MALDHGMLAAELHRSRDHLAFDDMPDVQFFLEVDLLDHDVSFLDDGNDRGVTLGPHHRVAVDDAADRDSGHVDAMPVQRDLGDFVANFRPGRDGHVPGDDLPLRHRYRLVEDLQGSRFRCPRRVDATSEWVGGFRLRPHTVLVRRNPDDRSVWSDQSHPSCVPERSRHRADHATSDHRFMASAAGICSITFPSTDLIQSIGTK